MKGMVQHMALWESRKSEISMVVEDEGKLFVSPKKVEPQPADASGLRSSEPHISMVQLGHGCIQGLGRCSLNQIIQARQQVLLVTLYTLSPTEMLKKLEAAQKRSVQRLHSQTHDRPVSP